MSTAVKACYLPPMALAPELLEVLRCPRSRQPLRYVPPRCDGPEGLLCLEARLFYRIEDGIPILLVEEASELTEDQVAGLLAYLSSPLGQ